MTKAALRTLYNARKKELTTPETAEKSAEIFTQFQQHFSFKPGDTVHCFLSIAERNEVDTRLFLNYFFERDVRVFVPKVSGADICSVEIFPDTVFIKSKWNIPEPESNTDCGLNSYTMILVPLLYADANGNRVGYGKGFYDRFFATLKKNTPKAGLSFFSPEEPVEDVSEWDVPLDYLVTPTEVLSFAGGTSNFTK